MAVILVIDDSDADVALMREAMCEAERCIELIGVPTAVQGLAFLAKEGGFAQMPDPDLVLLDINMPVINGLEALRLIRATSTFDRIPVWIWSSSSRRQDHEQARQFGAAEYVVKPMEWNGLLALAHRLAHVVRREPPCAKLG